MAAWYPYLDGTDKGYVIDADCRATRNLTLEEARISFGRTVDYTYTVQQQLRKGN